MELDCETQRMVLAICVVCTILVLVVDYALWLLVGRHATISEACQYGYTRWPATFALFLLWVGFLLGHLCPTR